MLSTTETAIAGRGSLSLSPIIDENQYKKTNALRNLKSKINRR